MTACAHFNFLSLTPSSILFFHPLFLPLFLSSLSIAKKLGVQLPYSAHPAEEEEEEEEVKEEKAGEGMGKKEEGVSSAGAEKGATHVAGTGTEAETEASTGVGTEADTGTEAEEAGADTWSEEGGRKKRKMSMSTDPYATAPGAYTGAYASAGSGAAGTSAGTGYFSNPGAGIMGLAEAAAAAAQAPITMSVPMSVPMSGSANPPNPPAPSGPSGDSYF
jgi:hypothetical protein